MALVDLHSFDALDKASKSFGLLLRIFKKGKE